MTPQQERTALAAVLLLIAVLVVDLVAWLRLGKAARQLTEARQARPGDGPTGDSQADLDALRDELAGDDER